MMFTNFPQPQKLVAIALTAIGMYSGMSLSIRLQAQAQTDTLRSTSSLFSSQATTTSLFNNSNNILVQQPNQRLEIQLAQDPTLSGEGSPDRSPIPGGGTNAQEPTVPGGGSPGRTIGGGSNVFPSPPVAAPGSRTGETIRSRGSCPRVTTPLTALMPITQGTSSGQSASTSPTTLESIYGLTVAERPTFWFYVPYSLTPSRPVEFVLQDENDQEIYQTQFTESGTIPGVVSLQLPSSVPPLEVGKRYHWYFLIYCNSDESTFVEGWVERVAPTPTLTSQLNQATTPQQKAAAYAQAGIWYEALTTLGEVRRQTPDDEVLNAEWLKLLQSVDLEAIANEPITSVLSPE